MRALIILIIWFGAELDQLAAQKLKVLATASMWKDLAEQIGGPFVQVDLIVPVGSDPHSYEPTPDDLFKVNEAQLILVNGLSFEGWLDKLIRNSSAKHTQVLITKGVKALSNPEHPGAYDPHAWMTASNGAIYAQNIANALVTFDPAHSKEYQFNAGVYIKQLEDLDKYILQQIQRIPAEHRVLVTSHDAFHYYGLRYGLELHSLLGTSTDADVQAGDLISINALIKKRAIPAIFTESTVNPKLIQSIREENSISIGGSLYADSLGDEKSPASDYQKMLRHNTDVIVRALTGSFNFTHQEKLLSPTAVYSSLIGIYLLLFYAFLYLVKSQKK